MLIGGLDAWVTLQEPTSASTGRDGHSTSTFTPRGPVSARVTGQRGEESFIAARTESRRIIKVLIRFRDDVQTDWQLTWNGETYDIQDVDRSKQRQGELWLMCNGRKVG